MAVAQDKAPIWSLILMLSGGLIGSGLLALPICIGLAGFWPALAGLIGVWIFMTFTGCVVAGRVVEHKENYFDIPSLFGEVLGSKLKWVAIVANVILLYGLLVAYLAGASSILDHTFHLQLNTTLTILIVFVIMTALNVFGIHIVRRGNIVFMAILVVSFLYLLFSTGAHMQTENFHHIGWIYLVIALPVLVNAYNCHNLIPTVCTSLDFDLKKIRFTIIGGLLVGFIINTSWTIAVVGAMKMHGFDGLLYSFQHNYPVTVSLSHLLHTHLFLVMALLFGLMAILTSYITMGAALCNFVRDLRVHYSKINSRYMDLILAFIPPLIITIIMPNIFLSIQSIIGSFGIGLLFGFLPALMFVGAVKTAFGKLWGYLVAAFFLIVMLLVTLNDFGFFIRFGLHP